MSGRGGLESVLLEVKKSHGLTKVSRRAAKYHFDTCSLFSDTRALCGKLCYPWARVLNLSRWKLRAAVHNVQIMAADLQSHAAVGVLE